jgi:septal ring factor EnvC (AmiA/AmiB activator)
MFFEEVSVVELCYVALALDELRHRSLDDSVSDSKAVLSVDWNISEMSDRNFEMATPDTSELTKLRRELDQEREKCKTMDVRLKKLEDELHVTKMHVKLLKKKPHEEIDTTKHELDVMRIMRDRLEHELRRTQRQLWALTSKADHVPDN